MKPEDLIQYFKPRFRCNINESTTLAEAEWFLERHPGMSYDPKIEFDVWLPTYNRYLQRELCWTPFQKSNLIISILKDIKIPPLTIVQVRDREAEEPLVWEVIDGKQRFTTVLGFLRNEFPVVIDWNDETHTSFYYKDLPEELQRKIAMFEFRANMVHSNIYHENDMSPEKAARYFVSDKDKVELYLYINYAGTQQDVAFMSELVGLVGD